MNLHQLRQRKTELRSATKAIIDAPAGTDGLLSDEQRTAYDSKITELDRILGDEQRLAELLASRRFAVEEIARVYGVPPPLVGDLSHGTFTNSREAARWFGQFTLILGRTS